MKLSQLDYYLPKELIAQTPIEPRDHSKLMVIDRSRKSITHKHFYDIYDLLTPNDVLVFNQSKVFPARLFGQKETGGKVEILLLENINKTENEWLAMRAGKVAIGQTLAFGHITGIVNKLSDNILNIKFSCRENELLLYLNNFGVTPLPPYIKGSDNENDLRKKYQTVYAKNVGSVAAPTAGFHFTHDLISRLKNKGIQMEYVTLHVGLGTFLPIKEDDISHHKIHSENFEIEKETLLRLNNAKKAGKRIIAVGTTSVRVLESIAKNDNSLNYDKLSGQTNIFIYPPYKFKFVDALITNFHLPHSTLLALVSALVSFPNTNTEFENFKTSLIGSAYDKAIENKYRFFSFGDASLIV